MKRAIAIVLFCFISIFVSGQTDSVKTEWFDCSGLESKTDKFTGEITIVSPILEPVVIRKIISNGKETYYISLSTIGATPATGTGVSILFDNGQKIVRMTEETRVRVNLNAQFEHSAFFPLSQSELQLLQTNKITDIKLYIFTLEITQGDRYRSFVNCLLKRK